MPGPEFREQVVRVPRELIGLPLEQEVFERLEAELPVPVLAVEGLGVCPPRVHSAEGAQAAVGEALRQANKLDILVHVMGGFLTMPPRVDAN